MAHDALQQSLLACTRRENRSSHISAVAEDTETSGKSILALVLWMLGYPDQALQLGRDAVATTCNIAVPYSMAIAHCFLALLIRFLRDIAGTFEQADSSSAYLRRARVCSVARAGFAGTWLGASNAGSVAAGIKEIQSALASAATVGATGSITKLADVCLHAKRTEQGLKAINEALRLVSDHGESTWDAELYRLNGELLA